VFLAQGEELNPEGRLEGSVYIDSSMSFLWHSFGKFRDTREGLRLVNNSANFFEAALNNLLPDLHENHPVIYEFGRNVSGLKLQAITSGINGSNLNPFNKFVVAPRR
jgi:hypothetical protein